VPNNAKVNNINHDSIYKDAESLIINPKAIFEELISIGIIIGKKITGNKKLFDVEVLVSRKITIPNPINPKFVRKHNRVKLKTISKFKPVNSI
jgi:hypothetical protein